MPLQMQATGGGSNGGVIDLYSPYMQQQQYAQQQRQADWQAVMNAFQQFARMKAENDFLKSQGITGQKPVTKTAEVGSPEWNRFAQEQMQKGIVVTPESGKINYPTGKTQSFFDQSKIPPGMKITIPGTGFEVVGQQPGITTIPEGFEVAGYNAEGQPYVKKIKPEQELVPAINRQTGQPILDSEGNPVYIDKKSKLIGKSSLNDLIGDLIKDEVLPKSKENKEKIKSPYKEYPDAFQENSVWKVIRNGKKYKIEG